MKKLTLLPCLLIAAASLAQTKLTIQSTTEKVAEVFNNHRNENFDDRDGFRAQRYYNGSQFETIRSFLQFDLSSIPAGSFLNWARLSLFNPGGYGPVTVLLRRVTSAWDPATVTWNTQPSTTKRGTIRIYGSSQTPNRYLNINVWKLVQPMIDNPATGFGFEIRLDTENVNKETLLFFVTPVFNRPHYNPKLVIEYTVPGLQKQNVTTMSVDLDGSSTQMSIYPNPCNGTFNCNIKSASTNNETLRVVDMLGRTVYSQPINTSTSQIRVNLPSNSAGTYFVVLQDEKNAAIVSQEVQVN